MNIAIPKFSYPTSGFAPRRSYPGRPLPESSVGYVKSEKADNYCAVIARLNDRWRIIDSMQPFPFRQWILQQRTGKSEWKSRCFCQSRITLERCIRDKAGLTRQMWWLPAFIAGEVD